MPANDFLVFGGGAGANVMSQADWEALTQRLSGFQSGVAQSSQLNKAWRQSSIMAAVLAQFISDQTGQDVLDDGTIATILANMKKAMPGRLLRTTVYTRMGGVQQVSVDGGAFTSTGAGTFTPSVETASVIVELCGAGGGGGGTNTTTSGAVSIGGGGGGGAYAKSRFLSGFSGIPITIGAAGTGGVVNGNGAGGGSTSFGSLLSAAGGVGGAVGSNSTPPYVQGGASGGASPTLGNISNMSGGIGIIGVAASIASFISSAGASGVLGVGGQPIGTASASGLQASGYGAGGGGGANGSGTPGQTGGTGSQGVVIVYEYL